MLIIITKYNYGNGNIYMRIKRYSHVEFIQVNGVNMKMKMKIFVEMMRKKNHTSQASKFFNIQLLKGCKYIS